MAVGPPSGHAIIGILRNGQHRDEASPVALKRQPGTVPNIDEAA